MDTRAEREQKIKTYSKVFKLFVCTLIAWLVLTVLVYHGLAFAIAGPTAVILTIIFSIAFFIGGFIYLGLTAEALGILD
jgi:hypothetical protein